MKKKKLNTIKQRSTMALSMLLLFFLPTAVSASGLEGSVFVTGTTKLLNDAGKIVAVLSPLVASAVVGYCFVRRGAADEMDHKKWTNRINVAIVSGIAGTLGGTIITVLSGYFK